MSQDDDKFSLEMFRRPDVVDLLVRVVFEGGLMRLVWVYNL